MIQRALPFALCLALSACTDFPEVGAAEATLTNPGITPPLLTSDALAQIAGAPVIDRSGALLAQAAALRARAVRLRQR